MIKNAPLNSSGKADSFKGIGSFRKTNDSGSVEPFVMFSTLYIKAKPRF